MDAAPDVIAGQPDMLPAERRDMFGGFRSHIAALAVQLSKRVFEINSISRPKTRQQIPTRSAMGTASQRQKLRRSSRSGYSTRRDTMATFDFEGRDALC